MEERPVSLHNRQDVEPEEPNSNNLIQWVAVLCLFALLGCAAWYWYPSLAKYQRMIAELPVVRESISAIGPRLSGMEKQMHSWVSLQEGLDKRLTAVENTVGAKLRASVEQVRRASVEQVREAREALAARLNAELSSRDIAIDARFAQMEAKSEAERAALESIRTELTQLKQSADQQQTRMASLEQNSSADKELLQQRLEGVRDNLQAEQKELASKIEMKRLNFEVSTNRSQELAPGVSLRVTKTNVSRKRVNGWMWILPDRKTIWLRDQGAMQPVIYYSSADGRRRELVFTQVTQGGAVGYLLLPADAEATPHAAVPSDAPVGN